MDIDPQLLLAALADSTRLRVTVLLARHRELCVCELVAALDTQQPKVSKHLAILRGNGIILARRQGHWIYYRLSPELPAWACDAIDALVQGCTIHPPYDEDAARLADSKRVTRCL